MSEICEEVIHYPSEDYPCLCERLVPDDATGMTCVTCFHDVGKHSFSHPQRGEEPALSE